MKYFAFLCIILSLGTVGVAAHPQTSSVMPLGEALFTTSSAFVLGDAGVCYTGCGGVPGVPSADVDYEQQVIELVNAQRLVNGNLPPLKRVDSLTDSARYHATDMGQDDYFNHDSYDRVNGALVRVCGTWDRVLSYYGSGWNALAENIAAGYSTPEAVMTGWMNSSGHRANILNPNLREIGVGYAYVSGSSYGRYWVQNFGSKSARYPVVINRETAITDDYYVSLYLYGVDVWTEMRLRNDADAWTAWQPFQSSIAWTLPQTKGMHTVTVEMRNSNSSTTSSDTIYLSRDYLATLGNLPATGAFIYSIPEGQFMPERLVLSPQNATSDATLVWTVTQSGNWFTLDSTSGSTPDTFILTPYLSNPPVAGTYTGNITVTVTQPLNTQNSPQSINLTLHVIESPIRRIYLPLLCRYP